MIENVGTQALDGFKAEARRLLENSVQHRTVDNNNSALKSQDRVTLGNQPVDAGTYSATVAPDTIASDHEIGTTFTLLRDLVVTTFQEQSIALKVSTGAGDINLETLTPQQATELVAEDGYFGVKKTAQRIFDFATGLAGNDPGRLDAIVAGIEDGFKQAEQVWGGTLPDISYQTRDTLMSMLEEWSGQGSISE